jgi:hypothetical protein
VDSFFDAVELPRCFRIVGLANVCFASKEDSMIRMAFAVAIATLAFTTVSGVSQAAPIAPLPTGVKSDAAAGNITQVYWHRHHHCWWRHGYRHCW